MDLPVSTNETMRMTDTTIEETSAAGSSSSMTESVTEIASSETAIMQTSEMSGAEINGRPEEVEDFTEIFETTSEKVTPIK